MQLLTSPSKLTVQEEAIFRYRFEIRQNISVGSQIYLPLYIKPFENFIEGVTDDWLDNNLVTVIRSDNGNIKKENIITNPDFAIVSDFQITIIDSPLLKGEHIDIEFGSENNKLWLSRKQMNFKPECLYRESCTSPFIEVEIEPITIKALAPLKVKLSVPSVARPRVPFYVVVYLEDKYANICDTLTGDIHISCKHEHSEIKYKLPITDISKNEELKRYEIEIILEEEGVFTFTANYKDLYTQSNPLLSDHKSEFVYWGDLHVHSQISDGKGEIEDVIVDAYKRGWDFVTVTDHSFGREERGNRLLRLQRQTDIIKKYTIPGKFIPIFGGETHSLWYTHVNLYFRHNDPVRAYNLLNEIDVTMNSWPNKWEDSTQEENKNRAKAYWDTFNNSLYGESETLALFHHTMWLGCIDFLDDKIRLVEVASIFGSSETREQIEETDKLKMQSDRIEGDKSKKLSIREALDNGYQWGFVGGSDNHEGQAGTHSITGIKAEELTRESLWDSMYNRKCYVTTSHKSYIDIKHDKKHFSGKIICPSEIDEVGFIADGEVVHVVKGDKKTIIDISFVLDIPFKKYIYFRVKLTDGNMAWYSPFWSDK